MEKKSEIEKTALMDNIEELSRFTEDSLMAMGFSGDIPRQEFMMAVDEAITNILMYAYDGPPGTIRIVVRRSADEISVELVDSGKAFDPTVQPAPDFGVSLEERPIGGMGVPLMRGFTSSLKYFRKDSHNHFILTRKIGGENA